MGKKRSEELYNEALGLIPGGVNSPVRAFQSVHDKPFYVSRAKGSFMFDVDGNSYLDFVSSWGAVMLGHADDGLTREIQAAVANGTTFGACHEHEVLLARQIIDAFPSIERVRLVNSGTEATMSAVRLARGASGKVGIIKFRGCYHGHVDSLLVKAGSGLATYGVPDSKGIPADLAKHTLVAEFNDIDTVSRIVKGESDIACLIIEPVMGNMGVILPKKGFLGGRERPVREAPHHPDIRRGDHRLQDSLWGRAGAVQDTSGPHVSGKDHGRWFSHRGLRWKEGAHGDARAPGGGIPGRHALRKSRCGQGGLLCASPSERRRSVPIACAEARFP